MELKSCPFCGGKATLIPLGESLGYVSCIGECMIRTSVFWDEPMKAPKEKRTPWKEDATSAWNRRIADET